MVSATSSVANIKNQSNHIHNSSGPDHQAMGITMRCLVMTRASEIDDANQKSISRIERARSARHFKYQHAIKWLRGWLNKSELTRSRIPFE